MFKLPGNVDLSSQKGVSIAELSIVILVIGLLVAIVSGGISLKNASELRGIITDTSAFRISVESFEQKYAGLPGDMVDAHDYWDDGAGGVCGTAEQCNGDGDGEIDNSATANDNEMFRAWQHIELAGFRDGGFTGVGLGDGDQADVGVNVPATKRPGGGYTFEHNKGSSATFPNGNAIVVGKFLVDYWTAGALFTPSEAYSVDKKMDDGNPDTGVVAGRYFYNGAAWETSTCLSGVYPGRAYDKIRTDTECILYFNVDP